jgi:hypothetical protein
VAARAIERRFNADTTDHAGPTLPCRCGRPARYAGRRDKTFTTALGELTLSRAYYHCEPCAGGFCARVRALGHACRVAVADGPRIDADDLPEEFSDPAEPADDSSPASLTALVGRPLAELEKLFVSETLRLTAGNREEAAKMLGIGERTLYRKLKEYDLPVGAYDSAG